MPRITPNLWFDTQGLEAAEFYWEKLTDGGEESQCGWLEDRYGLSWQVVPTGLVEALDDPDQARSQRAMQAMLGMRKIDLAAIRAAADGAGPSSGSHRSGALVSTCDAPCQRPGVTG